MLIQKNYSENPSINLLLENILDELCPFLEEQAREISELTAIGKALGTGKDISMLLEMILSIARRFTKADGGTLYRVDDKDQSLLFKVIHNESLHIKKRGDSIDLPKVPLYKDDKTPNLSNVSSYVFHTGNIVKIDDVYKATQFKFDGTKKFDKALHYRSKSMLVLPMRNHEDDIIGILQLINSKNPTTQETVPFNNDHQEKAAALASQAAVILTQQMLILEMKQLFEAFIKAIAISIDEKSSHTGGHIQRVTELCMLIAGEINQDTTIFKDTSLFPDQMNELRIAALMHDTGKITTPDHIINKSSRLETIYDRIDLIQTRWELFKTNQKLMAAEKKLTLFDSSSKKQEINLIDEVHDKNIKMLDNDFQTISKINLFRNTLDNSSIKSLVKIHEKSATVCGSHIPYLTEDEFENLCILKGTLTPKEREIINNHARITKIILDKLPWPKKLARVPSIAGAHHEKLDGSGYPLHLNRDKLNIQARILAVADIFEALSALDRPYKKPMTLSRTVKILEQMGKDGQIDKDIIKIFFKSKAHIEYAKKHLSREQMDI